MVLSSDAILDRLRGVKYPGYSRDIVSFGLIKDIALKGSQVAVRIALTTADEIIPKQIEQAVLAALESMPGISEASVQLDVTKPAAVPSGEAGGLPQTKIPGVKHVIAVASGKGGVGKSTIAANLALALQRAEGEAPGARVGLCDCDIYGPSIALMFGTSERPAQSESGPIIPIQRYGLNLMSMGFLLEDNAPAILRGPMVTKYTQQFLRWVNWAQGGELDYLVLDLPPGTGDIQLTIVQTVALSGAIIVTTPQEVALIDARKAAAMFARVNVPLLGLIENMSYFISPTDQTRHDIFGTGGGQREADRLQIPLLAQIPLEMAMRSSGDQGRPMVEAEPDSKTAQAFFHAAREVKKACADA